MKNVTALDGGARAVTKQSNSSPAAMVKHFVDLDKLVVAADLCERASHNVYVQMRESEDLKKYYSPSSHFIDSAKRTIERGEAALHNYNTVVAEYKLNELLAAISPKQNDPDCEGGFPSQVYVTKQVALLLGAIPSGNPADPAAYVALMAAEITASKFQKLAIETGMRMLRRECRFLPSVSEVITRLERENTLWLSRMNIDVFHSWRGKLQDELENVKALLLRAESGESSQSVLGRG